MNSGYFGYAFQRLGSGRVLLASLVAASCAVTFEDYPVYEDSPRQTGGRSTGGSKATTGGGDGGDSEGGGSAGTGGSKAGTGGTPTGDGGKATSGGSSTTGGTGTSGASPTGGTGPTTGGSGTGGAVGSCDCTPGSNTNTLLIQNFEDGSGAVLPYGSRSGGFFTFVSQASTVSPLPDTDMTPECTGSAGDCYQLCATGSIAGGNFAVAALAVNLADDALYDLSPYYGISFYFSVQMGSLSRLEFHAATRLTMQDIYGGACVPTVDLDCNDHYTTTIVSGSSYTGTFSISFGNLTQGGWGVPAPWTPGEVLELHWQVTSTTDAAVTEPFTLCLDDVTLLQ